MDDEQQAKDVDLLLDFSARRIAMDLKVAQGKLSSLDQRINAKLEQEWNEFVTGKAFLPLTAEGREILIQVAVRIIQKYQVRSEKASRPTAPENDPLVLQTRINDLQKELQLLKTKLSPESPQDLIDDEVIRFAGIFEKALRVSEDVYITAGVTAKAVWSKVRVEANDLFCTDSLKYATARKIARESLPLTALVLTELILQNFEVSAKVANSVSKLFLVVCDAGREEWCMHYNSAELASKEEIARLGEIRQFPQSE